MDAKTRENYSSTSVLRTGAPGRSDGSESRTNSANLLTDLKTSWKSMDGAGSHFLFNLCSSLAGSQYEGLSRDLVAVLGPMFGCGESELVLCHLRKMESLLGGLQTAPGAAGNQDKQAAPNELMLCRCLLQFLKLQADYHHMCSTTLSSVIDHVVSTTDSQRNPDLVQEIRSLGLTRSETQSQTRSETQSQTQSPTRVLGHKKGQLNNGSPRTQKHGFKASLFSLFERKNSPEEGNSSFYVDIGPNENAGNGVKLEGDHVTDGSQSEMLVQLGLDPGLPDNNVTAFGTSMSETPLMARGMKLAPEQVCKDFHANGEVATQEELDSVINLLSGVVVGNHMQTIPEHHDAIRLQVPSGHASSLSPATSEYSVNERGMQMSKGQRRSEGSIDLSGFGATPGTNTWPNQHRSSLPGGQLVTYSQVLYDFNTPGMASNYATDMRPTTLPPGGAGHFQGGYNWSFPDPKLNRTWPVTNLTGTGSVTDTINSSWSGAQDSDDLSDDSSSAGDQFHNMTHNVQSGDQRNFPRDDSLAGVGPDDRGGEVKHHSLEDLLNGRSNTWPQQFQPWSQSPHGLDLSEPRTDHAGDQAGGFHRPLQMQLSDPLSRRNVWPNSGEPVSQQLPPPQNIQGLRPL